MRMDERIMCDDLSGTLELLQRVSEGAGEQLKLPKGRSKRLHQLYEACEDETLKKSFKVSSIILIAVTQDSFTFKLPQNLKLDQE